MITPLQLFSSNGRNQLTVQEEPDITLSGITLKEAREWGKRNIDSILDSGFDIDVQEVARKIGRNTPELRSKFKKAGTLLHALGLTKTKEEINLLVNIASNILLREKRLAARNIEYLS